MPASVIGAIGSVLGANEQSDAIQGAAGTSAAASNYAADLQKQMYDQTRADQSQWREAGGSAISQIHNAVQPGAPLVRPFSMADYQADPGYAFRLSEGTKALDRSASARGQLLSGSALKGLTRFGQDQASQEYQNAYNRYNTNQTNQFNRLASVAGVGQNANNALANAGTGYANATSAITMNNANNQANAGLAQGQANASMYQGIGNALGGSGGNSSSNWGAGLANVGNYFGGNFGPSGNWIDPDTGSSFIYK